GPIERAAAPRRRMAGLVLPHMDPRCAGVCASWGLKALAEAEPPELLIVFGTSHQPLPNLFSASDKDFATPLGIVHCDKGFVARLRGRLGAERLAGELVHKGEHSIEFQAVYLHALYGEPAPFQIVPILCGSFQEFIANGRSPSENAEFAEFRRALRETAEESGKRVCYVAGADLAHMGRKFGDEDGLSDKMIHSVRERDLEMLGRLERLDAEGFFRFIHKEGDERKVCGLPPMYAMMRCMAAGEGKLLKYDFSVEPPTQSMVSFCSMAFYE
ncbi:MAG: AmmeMemoRadiSam system protein B, partial [Candidatus Sumerlaeota bacterium]|nr:AmmeMemoRadiSam system protein B [Candidatus Sumerlaeota bacterium]